MIGFAACECLIYNARSLKDKRAVLQRVLTRIRQRYNVSVAEIDHQEAWQRAKIGLVAIASSRRAAERELERALALLDSFPELERAATVFEWL
ncbi:MULTISPECIES: DUF503 domain-containing protein [Geobacillus]|uniref:YlxP-like protein n=2 Tax=Geobacillus TaxID=129337 RepID=A0A679FSD1_9BACL|nr:MULTISPECIES: DUF503 family protein [Geobacillus]NNV04979.1 DUF503 family protein [Geobacillus sp. MMMUD3]KYD23789.1 hypothetical protein B4113_3154 [Geobacillus sp. B4113_201601]MEB3749606.1 hypothetical protein [Geobacillus icigianus]TWG30118.1 hypothetical protein GC56T2_1238 [Geobacillus sp. C56-T2]BBW96646.1 hypothetical protein GsuE55_14790 [Geobacillus subterraneus]